MKKKIVVWGADENDKKILVALELLAKENKVNIYTFDESIATEEFFNTMMDEWRPGKEVEFPEGFVKIEKPLSMTDDLLPETIKVLRADVITRAKAEWHFVVLSSKLYDLYHSELEDLKERVSKMVDFEGGVFEELKSFWSKVAEQARERNIFRDQADKLKDQTNELFGKLKELRTQANSDLAKLSKETYAKYASKLDELNEKVEKGLGLNPIFEELKRMQADFKNEKFTRDDRNKLWNRIDASFKTLKEKKYGKKEGGSDNNNHVSRLDRRFQGLMSAIDKMEKSIARDKKDIDFQKKRVADTDGQLEMQIRQAKIVMIEERIKSKQEKLDEMLATKIDLEKMKAKEEAKAAKRAEKAEIEKKKAELKEKVASEIAQKNTALEQDSEKLAKAAKAINKKPNTKAEQNPEPKKESLLGAISTVAGEAFENVVDTVKAVSEVVGDQVGDKVDELREKLHIDEKVEAVKEMAKEVKEEVAGTFGEMKEKASEIKDDIVESVGEMKEKASEIKDDVAESVSETVEDMKEKASEIKDDVAEKADEIKSSMTDDSKDGAKKEDVDAASIIEGMFSKVTDMGAMLVDELTEAVTEMTEKAGDIIEDIKEDSGDSEEE
jgi:DNA repair exonuclease SbcCD ATPase subunit